MFTGIVEELGRVHSFEGTRLRIEAHTVLDDVHLGDSIAVIGCCLTVVGMPAPGAPLRFDVVPQTLSLTTAGSLAAGDAVNLEHAATPSTLLGGHVVQGHVDAVGDVLAVSQAGGEWRTRIAAPAAVAPHLVERGSVAVDGVSLTVAAVGAGWFEVALIPATLAKTTLRARLAGSRVNLEADAMSKLVAEHVRRALAAGGRAV